MKFRQPRLVILLGLLASAPVALAFDPTVYIYDSHGNEIEIRPGDIKKADDVPEPKEALRPIVIIEKSKKQSASKPTK